MNELMARYTGDKAKDYDKARKQTVRYIRENEAFAALVGRLGPIGSVIDCPVGTCRWLPWLTEAKGPIYGVDISEDMLALAADKVKGDARVVLAQGDVRRSALRSAVPSCDLVICIRLLNWLSPADARLAVANLAGRADRAMILGVSVMPRQAGLLRRMKILRRRMRGAGINHVHDERDVRDWIDQAGLKVEERIDIIQKTDRDNIFLLLKRTRQQARET